LSSIGQALNQLVQVLPQIMVIQVVLKLVMNDLLHIVVEPVRTKEQVTDEKIVELVRKYNTEYGGPASWADIVFDMAPEPVKRMVDRWWNSEEGRRIEQDVKQRLETLVAQGRLRRVDGGYVV